MDATPHPLVISSDDGLVDDLLHLLAAAGTTAELTHGGAALRRAHRAAPLVLVGADALTAPAVRALPRRPGVVVAAREELGRADFDAALALGAERVVRLPQDEGWLVERAARAVTDPVETGTLTVVTGACGGVGASTLAAALALSVRGERATVLVDADGQAGGLDLVLGAEWADGLRWPDLAGLRGRVDGGPVVAALPRLHGVHVLAPSRGAPAPVPAPALAAVVAAARAGGHPVVVDLPVRADPAVVEPTLAEADLVVLVVPDRVRALAAAGALLADPVWSRAVLVARTAPGGVGAAEVGEVLGRPVVAELVHDRSALPRGERGEPPQTGLRTPLGQVVRRLLPRLQRAVTGG